MSQFQELEDWKHEWAKTFGMIMAEECPEGERHCTCVPFLRVKVKELENEKREIENEAVLANSILETIQELLDGQEPNDFMLSFPLVRQLMDLCGRVHELEAQDEKLLEAINNFPSVAVCAALTSWGIGLSFSENINELITACANFADLKQVLKGGKG